MATLFSHPRHLLLLSSYLLFGGLALLTVGLLLAYGLQARLTIATQVLGHSLVILGPTLLKVGYVLRLVAHHQLHKECAHALA